MSDYQQRDNSGSLFRNNKKEEDNHPDYNGSCMIDGVEYWMNAWLKESKKGTKFMSFSFKPKEGGSKSSSRGGSEAAGFF